MNINTNLMCIRILTDYVLNRNVTDRPGLRHFSFIRSFIFAHKK